MEFVDFSKPSFLYCLILVLFCPLQWNLIARNEHRNRTLSRLFGSPYRACYFLAAEIFSISMFRDELYRQALVDQPTHPLLANAFVMYAGVLLMAAGSVFVLSSMWVLGITGTYLGDHCGILMKERVTTFPFNVLGDPMYVGSVMNFAGSALIVGKPMGLVISTIVALAYYVAVHFFEGPFTAAIYAAKGKKKKTVDATPQRRSTRVAARMASTSPVVKPDSPTSARRRSRRAE